MFEIRRMILV